MIFQFEIYKAVKMAMNVIDMKWNPTSASF